jgi:hypothetical protein
VRPIYKPAIKDIENAISGLFDELSDSILDGKKFLPPKTPSPFGYTTDAAAYKAYLETRNPKVLLLAVIVKEGIFPAQAEDDGNLQGKEKEVKDAIEKIEKLRTVSPQPSPDDASQKIQSILLDLHSKLFPAPQMAPNYSNKIVRTSEFETLQLEIQTISTGIWLLYGVLTVLTGAAVLILSNPGFGIPVDFIFAFFWGFGLPATVGALAPGSAAGALNISVAKG